MPHPLCGHSWFTFHMTSGEPTDAVRFVELHVDEAEKFASLVEFSNDLDECIDALERVIALEDHDDLGIYEFELSSHLINSALITYFRCFMNSGRDNLDGYIAIPADMVAFQEEAKQFRNRAIAHADSGTRRSFVQLRLEMVGEKVQLAGMLPVIAKVNPPLEFLEALLKHAKRLSLLVLEGRQKLSHALEVSLDGARLQTLWQRPVSTVPFVPAWNPSAPRANPPREGSELNG